MLTIHRCMLRLLSSNDPAWIHYCAKDVCLGFSFYYHVTDKDKIATWAIISIVKDLW